MVRIMTAVAALFALTAASPAHRQPTPASVQGTGDAASVSSGDALKNEQARDKAARENTARTKAWESKMNRTMSGVCRGC